MLSQNQQNIASIAEKYRFAAIQRKDYLICRERYTDGILVLMAPIVIYGFTYYFAKDDLFVLLMSLGAMSILALPITILVIMGLWDAYRNTLIITADSIQRRKSKQVFSKADWDEIELITERRSKGQGRSNFYFAIRFKIPPEEVQRLEEPSYDTLFTGSMSIEHKEEVRQDAQLLYQSLSNIILQSQAQKNSE